jgi:hypothetical protein
MVWNNNGDFNSFEDNVVSSVVSPMSSDEFVVCPVVFPMLPVVSPFVMFEVMMEFLPVADPMVTLPVSDVMFPVSNLVMESHDEVMV